MADNSIFIVGFFVTALLLGGIFMSAVEFRKMNRNPEKYLKPE